MDVTDQTARKDGGSFSWNWFQAFFKVQKFSRKTSIRLATYVLLYLDLLVLIAFYILDIATLDIHVGSTAMYVWLALQVLSGLHVFAFVILGFPFLFPAFTCWRTAFVDFLAWIALVVMGSYDSHIGHGTEEEEEHEERALFTMAILLFLLVVRLNTFLAFNLSLDTLPWKHNTSKQAETTIGVPLATIAEVIAESAMSESCKSILNSDAVLADVDDTGNLSSAEFFYFKYKSMKRNILWQAPGSNERMAYRDLLTMLCFDALIPEQDEVSLEEDAEDDDAGIFSTVKVATKLLFHSQKLLGCSVVLSLCVGAVAQPAFVLLVGKQVNLAVDMAANTNENDQTRQQFIRGIIGLLLLWLVDEASWYLSCIIGARVISNATARIQLELTKCALYGDVEFEEKYTPGALSNVFSSSISKAEQVWNQLLYRFIRPLASLLAAIVFLALFNISYAIFVASSFPLIASFHFLEVQATKWSTNSDASSARLLSRFQNTVNIQTAAKVCNAETFVLGRFEESLGQAKHGNFETFLWSSVVEAVFTTVGYGLNAITTVVFLFELAGGILNAGDFFAVTGYVIGVISPIEAIGTFSGDVARMSGAINKINTVLMDGEENEYTDDSTENDKDGSSRQASLSLDKELMLEHVCFSYGPDLPLILNDVSISIESGSYVCFMGKSGSGKSTLLSLLTGRRSCTLGRITMDGGADISSVPTRCLRESLAVVFQETFVLDGTIFDNIAFGCTNHQGDLNVMYDIVADAARNAQVHDFIDALPEKYDTVIGKEAKISLSGGQLQRICGVARALARRPKLLVLDEATSGMCDDCV